MTTHIGMVGLTAAGNFGDDLIALAVAQTVMEVFEDAVLHYVQHGRTFEWVLPSPRAGHRFRAEGHPLGRDLPLTRGNGGFFDQCDGVIFGGGGLLQTSHHPERPYQWLRLLPGRRAEVPVIAVGLGLGPLSPKWVKRLKAWGQPFDECHLRDERSVQLATALGWSPQPCRDFVDAEFLSSLGVRGRSSNVQDGVLGVALRMWPGLEAEVVAAHIDRIANRVRARHVRFYVLEATSAGPDVAFSREVMRGVSACPVSERLYSGERVAAFARDMAKCDWAISMKLHSNAVWSAAGTKIYPISYAPKTAAMFGVPYEGLEVFDTELKVQDDPTLERAQVVLATWLQRLRGEESVAIVRTFMPLRDRVGGQFRAFAINLERRARSLWAG